MNVIDTSVAVAGLSPWHEHHEPSRRVLEHGARLAGHAYVETYSTLTRLPDPFRVEPAVAADLLARRFRSALVHPRTRTLADLPERLAAAGISGGASYDALIALTALDHRATLVTLDERATPTYAALGVQTHRPT